MQISWAYKKNRLLAGFLVTRSICLNLPVDFLAVHLNMLGCIYTDTRTVAIDGYHGDSDVVADVDRFSDAAGKDEHVNL